MTLFINNYSYMIKTKVNIMSKANKRYLQPDKIDSKKVCKYHNFSFKVVVIGEANVGKTSLTRVFCGEDFQSVEVPTIGIGIYTTFVKRGKNSVMIDIYDTAGAERYASLTRSFLRATSGIILMYDINDPRTLEKSLKKYNEIKDYDDDYKPVVILVGSKSDLGNRTSINDVNNVVDDIKCVDHVVTSAKTGYNLDLIFDTLVDNMIINYNKYKNHHKSKSIKLSLSDKKPCCVIL